MNADDHAKKSEERRREYKRRLHQARLDGGSTPSEASRNDLLGRARDVARASYDRLIGRMGADLLGELPPRDKAPMEWLPPGHVAVRAEALLGFEIELADVLASREAVEQHRVALLGLMSRAKVLPGPGAVDLFKLETALETGKGLPRDAEAQLLEVVRELIRWRAAAGAQAAVPRGDMQPESPSLPPPGFYWARLADEPDRWQPVEVHARSDGRLFVVMLGDEGNGHVTEWGPALTPPAAITEDR